MKRKRNSFVPTTWMGRYRHAISLFCLGILPPLDICEAWIAKDSDSFALQDWVSCNTTVSWAQAIAILDAAEILADQPEEGVGHLDRKGNPRGVQSF